MIDEPESFVVSTRAGRLVIYDGDQPRPYATSDFPSQRLGELQPLFASSRYLYARQPLGFTSAEPIPCLARYPVDALGVALPEDICDLDRDWGRYPEMKAFGEVFALQEGNAIVDVKSFGGRTILDSATNIEARVNLLSFDFRTRHGQYRLTRISDLAAER